jgi:hypothetical protein
VTVQLPLLSPEYMAASSSAIMLFNWLPRPPLYVYHACSQATNVHVERRQQQQQQQQHLPVT